MGTNDPRFPQTFKNGDTLGIAIGRRISIGPAGFMLLPLAVNQALKFETQVRSDKIVLPNDYVFDKEEDFYPG